VLIKKEMTRYLQLALSGFYRCSSVFIGHQTLTQAAVWKPYLVELLKATL